MILVIRSDPFYSIGASCVTNIITPSDPTRETDYLDHDSSKQSGPNRICVAFAMAKSLKTVYDTWSNKKDGEFLTVAHFVPSVHKFTVNLALVLPMMLSRYGMSGLITSTLPHLFYLSERK